MVSQALFVILYKMKKLVLIAIITVASFTACISNTTQSNSCVDSTKCDSTCTDSLGLMDSIGVRQVVEMDKHPERY